MRNTNQKRILLVDDNQDIHTDFHKILTPEVFDPAIATIEAELFGQENQKNEMEEPHYIIDSAFQGKEALELVKKSMHTNQPYVLAFVDVRMPPGWDGIETIQKIWEVDPKIQVVICTAYADYSWKEIIEKLDASNNYLILKKPFDVIEIRQLVAALTKKWELYQEVRYQIENLQNLVEQRTAEVEKTLSLTRATLESTPEGIIVIGQDHKTVTYNQVFLQLWNITESILLSEKSFLIFKKLSNQVEESILFLKMMNHLTDHPNNDDNKEWQLKNGKILEHSIQPQLHNNKVIGTVFCFRDITERKKLEEQLIYQATHDSLTGLPNRLLFMDRLKQALVYAKKGHSNLSILLLDLDNFNEVNNSLGHVVGDLLLKQVAERLMNHLQDIDTVARLGGDEFVIILVDKDAEATIEKAKELLKVFLSPCKFENNAVVVTTSIGVAFYPEHGVDSMSLVKNADAALYHAKFIGKNNFQIYKPEFNDYLLEKTKLLSTFRQALEKNQFVLYYQPLVKSDTGRIIGLEALIRWQHPTLGLLLPHSFIPLAEETGLIVQMGEWVLKSACLQVKKWQETLAPYLGIAINISGFQLIQKDFVERVENILKETQFDPQFLELEMTESYIFKNINETIEKMQKIKSLGVHFSLDDFGTGYASFSYLKYFPFDKIKIDKSFIQGIHIDKNDDAIVEAILTMSKKMGIEVLAEGIEKTEQIDFLLKHHGNQVQGFYYGAPMDVEECTQLLEKQAKMI